MLEYKMLATCAHKSTSILCICLYGKSSETFIYKHTGTYSIYITHIQCVCVYHLRAARCTYKWVCDSRRGCVKDKRICGCQCAVKNKTSIKEHKAQRHSKSRPGWMIMALACSFYTVHNINAGLALPL